MANGTATVTGKTGANQTLTASVFSNVTGFNLLFGDNVLAITYGTPSKTAYISLDGVTVVSDSISGGVHTLTVS